MTEQEGVGPVAVAVVEALLDAGIPCALGGALALGVWGVPRGTTDVDLSAFVGVERHEELLDALAAVGCTFDRAEALARALEGEAVFTWKDGFRVDVFVPSIPFYEEAARRVETLTFRGRPLPFISAEVLAVFKLLFFRSKDLADLEALVAVQGPDLDHAWVREQMVEMLEEGDERVEAWDRIVASFGPAETPPT